MIQGLNELELVEFEGDLHCTENHQWRTNSIARDVVFVCNIVLTTIVTGSGRWHCRGTDLQSQRRIGIECSRTWTKTTTFSS